MLYRLMIFLILCGLASAQMKCYVGGVNSAGDHAGFNAYVGTSYGAGGEALATGTGDVTDGITWILITDTDAFGDAEADMYVNLDFVDNTHTDARGRIMDVVADDAIKVEIAYIGDEAVNWVLGGAVPATYGAEGVGTAIDLEGVLDSAFGSAAAQNVDILIYLAATQDIAEEIKVDSNGGSGAYRKSLIGCDSSYAALSLGSYVEYNNTNKTPGGFDVFEISVANITFENIAALDPGGNEQPDSGEACFNMTAGAVKFIARNCRAINGYYGFQGSGTNSALIDCVVYDCRVTQASLGGHGSTIMGGYYETDRNKTYASANVLVMGGLAGKIIGATVVGSVNGVSFTNYGQLVLNCNFKDQSAQAITLNSADSTLLVFNNIFKLANVDNDFEVTLTAGGLYSDYNLSNVVTTTLTGVNDVANKALSDTSPWVNAAKATDNYKLDRADALVAYALEAGWSPASLNGVMGAQSIGAFPTYDLPAKTAVVAPDTVYGIEGTSAGGNGGIFPQRIERRGD